VPSYGERRYRAVLRLNPARFPKADPAGATAFVEWLESDEAQNVSRTFGVAQYGELLFFPDSAPWHKRRVG
jgi:tungstate transport system substrate-binding protein